MKTIFISVVAITLLALPALLPAAESGGENGNARTVTGIGYPPIRAESPAQARLMARRAAVIDAYRNALAGSGSQAADEPGFYTGLSGFVKGLTIEREEYFEDGSVRITARVPGSGGVPPARTARESSAERSRGGPSPVPLNDWYRIIEQSVRYE